jgi:hypothetical protein
MAADTWGIKLLYFCMSCLSSLEMIRSLSSSHFPVIIVSIACVTSNRASSYPFDSISEESLQSNRVYIALLIHPIYYNSIIVMKHQMIIPQFLRNESIRNYIPHIVKIQKGDTIRWSNRDSESHHLFFIKIDPSLRS